MSKILHFLSVHRRMFLLGVIALGLFAMIGIVGSVEKGVLTIAQGIAGICAAGTIMLLASFLSGAFYYDPDDADFDTDC